MAGRRNFMRSIATAGTALSFSGISAAVRTAGLTSALQDLNSNSPTENIENEDIWDRIHDAFTLSPNILYLNSGGVSPQPRIVQDAVDRYYRFSNEGPSYYMWKLLDAGREPLRIKLSELTGTDPSTIAINRNATEALDTCIFGVSLKKGDEVVATLQDYPNMINAWKQREKRDGIKIKWINLEMPVKDPGEVVNAFIQASGSKTRVWHITHMINWNGQILPAGDLCMEATKRGFLSIVDGAHTFGQIDFKIADLNCDYFGTSLHKWLCAPFGTGLLYVNPKRISETYPLIPNHEFESNNIRKFEALGTRSFAPEQAIGQAIDFHQAIGSKTKQERLWFLKEYWCSRVETDEKITINSPRGKDDSCALALVNIKDMEPATLQSRLFSDFGIYTTAIVWENISGVRVSPHIYTRTKDLDRLINALLHLANEKK